MQPGFDADLADTLQRNYGPKFVTRLRSLNPLQAIINTFGFGREVRSNLLKSIAEVGRGNYTYVPDIEMIVSTPPQVAIPRILMIAVGRGVYSCYGISTVDVCDTMHASSIGP